MGLISRFNRPWLHFLLLGGALYYGQTLLFPEPRPVIGPLSQERVENLRRQWFSSARRAPTDEQLERVKRFELDRDMLFQKALELELYKHDEVVFQRLLRNMQFLGLADGRSDRELYEQALDMRLHLGDEVVKRRMIQVMEQLLLAANPPSKPTESEIIEAFDERRDALRRPPRYTLEHLYFPRERDDVAEVVQRIQAQQLTPDQAREYSSPFLPGYRFVDHSPDQLARQFGAGFVLNLQRAEPEVGHWTGPIESTYGRHYVYLEAFEPARDAELSEVRGQLQRDLEIAARDAALAEARDRLRQQYEVIL
jgi:hypothetical protein